MITGEIVTNDTTRYKYGQAGAIIPTEEYIEQLGVEIRKGAELVAEERNNPNYYEEMLRYVTSPDGHIYGMPTHSANLLDHHSYRAWFNMTFLEAVDKEIPKTQDELVDVLRAFRDDDPNGNGQKDEIPMVGSTNNWNGDVVLWIMNQYTYVGGLEDNRYMLITNGKLDWPFDKGEWRDGLRFTKSLIDEGLISTLSFTQDRTQYNALVSADTMVVGLGVSGSVSGFAQNIRYHEGADAIKGPNGAQYATYIPTPPTCEAVITRDCKEPIIAFLFMQSTYNDLDYATISRYGEPDVDWAYVSPSDNAVGNMEDAGYPALFRQINQIWGTPQTSHWNYSGFPPRLGLYRITNGQAWDGNEDSNETKNAKVVSRLLPYAPDFSKLFMKNVYTEEEIQKASEIRATMKEYVKEAYTLFVMGTLDLDKDWDQYLNELNNIGYQELLAIDQEAYNRTQGIN